MKTLFPQVFVFKTNINQEEDILKITFRMDEEERIKRWTIDRSDCDNVLRIESHNLQPDEIIELVNQAGYQCEELV